MLSTDTLINGTTLIQSIPWTYNASLPNWIAPIPLSSVVNFTVAEAPVCASKLTAMSTQGSIIHMICFSDEVGFAERSILSKAGCPALTANHPLQQKS